MQRTIFFSILCAVLLISAGCVNQGLPGTGSDSGTPTLTGVCDPQYKDGAINNCLIEKRPPDLRVGNDDSVPHNLSVRIVHNEATVFFSENVSVESRQFVTFSDVFDAPGVYNVTATVDKTVTESETYSFEKRYSGSGETILRVFVNKSGELIFQYGLGPA